VEPAGRRTAGQWSAALDGLAPLTHGRLVHGDFFPGNVILGSDLSVSAVVDFGLTAVSGDPLRLYSQEFAEPGPREIHIAEYGGGIEVAAEGPPPVLATQARQGFGRSDATGARTGTGVGPSLEDSPV
jgi:Phosphotransferase enzyme family